MSSKGKTKSERAEVTAALVVTGTAAVLGGTAMVACSTGAFGCFGGRPGIDSREERFYAATIGAMVITTGAFAMLIAAIYSAR